MGMKVGMIDRYGRAIRNGDIVMVDALIWDAAGIHPSGETLKAETVYFEDGSGSCFFFEKCMKPCEGGGRVSVENDYVDYVWAYKSRDLEVIEDWLGRRYEKGEMKNGVADSQSVG